MQDTNGRPYLKLADAKPGMIVEIDASFTCRKAGKAMLYWDHSRGIYFFCDDGCHYISGQCTDGIHCTGIYPAEEPASVEQAA